MLMNQAGIKEEDIIPLWNSLILLDSVQEL